jgi:hypothetical protein
MPENGSSRRLKLIVQILEVHQVVDLVAHGVARHLASDHGSSRFRDHQELVENEEPSPASSVAAPRSIDGQGWRTRSGGQAVT